METNIKSADLLVVGNTISKKQNYILGLLTSYQFLIAMKENDIKIGLIFDETYPQIWFDELWSYCKEDVNITELDKMYGQYPEPIEPEPKVKKHVKPFWANDWRKNHNRKY